MAEAVIYTISAANLPGGVSTHAHSRWGSTGKWNDCQPRELMSVYSAWEIYTIFYSNMSLIALVLLINMVPCLFIE